MADTATEQAAPQGRCHDNPAGWDLDSGDIRDWAWAIQQCSECPIRRQCLELLDEFYPHRGAHPAEAPHGVIWAGFAWTDEGRLLTPKSMRMLDSRHRSARMRAAPRELRRAS